MLRKAIILSVSDKFMGRVRAMLLEQECSSERGSEDLVYLAFGNVYLAFGKKLSLFTSGIFGYQFRNCVSSTSATRGIVYCCDCGVTLQCGLVHC